MEVLILYDFDVWGHIYSTFVFSQLMLVSFNHDSNKFMEILIFKPRKQRCVSATTTWITMKICQSFIVPR